MKIAREQFNPYALAVEEAQNDIRLLVKRAYLTGVAQSKVNGDLIKIIDKASNGIVIPQLKTDTRISLMNFANKQRLLWKSLGAQSKAIMFLGNAMGKENPPPPPSDLNNAFGDVPIYITNAVGVPLQKYYQDVWKDNVKPTLDKIAREQALDPNDFTGRNSLRNLAEMEVRYNDHQDNINSLRDGGAKLVVCSSHADCSSRCAKWQGRVYSLDGTSGVVDGHRYVPLETATDVWYTTKAGRRYKNGLLGFNCRHQLTEYKGQLLPTVTAEQRKKEYAVTMRQRELERAVRMAKAQALCNKGLNSKQYKAYSNQARELYSEYLSFCAANNRAYYPMRVQI